MINCDPIVIGTSLAPFYIEKQMRAVQSWIDNGFYVISCNAKEEMEIVRDAFSEIPVEFVEIDQTAERTTKKKLPYIQDIVNVVCGRAKKICGYINSDIVLSKMPNGMYEYIEKEAENSLVFVRRYEVSEYGDIQNLNWTLHFDGIDTFFMDKTLAQNFYDDDFYVQSVWDLCILIKCNILGIKVKELVNPFTFHLRHPIKWNFLESRRLVKQFINKYFPGKRNTYEYAQKLWYWILFAVCEKICFCDMETYRCLFVLNERDEGTIGGIQGQRYVKYDTVFSNEIVSEETGKYDITVKVKGQLNLDDVFCGTVIYVMNQFACDSLEIGRFFISERNMGKYYNELNRNMDVIKKVNEDCGLYTVVTKNLKNKVNVVKGKRRILYLPISYEMIDLMDDRIVDKMELGRKIYLCPAGIRSSEWFLINNEKTDIKICGFVDNNIDKIGKEVLGKPVYPVNVLKSEEGAVVVIASKYYGFEIERQLSELFVSNPILNASYILALESDNTLYYFNLCKYMKQCKKERM